MSTKRERRMMPDDHKGGGEVILIAEAEAEGYVMVRRPRCIPFVVRKEVWDSWEVVS